MPINTSSTFSHDKLDHTKENSGHLMVTLESPEPETFDRTKLCAILVLDNSGSMNGHMDQGKTKIQGLREVACCLVQQLSPQDELAIVTYSSTSDVVLKRVTVENKDKIYAIINKIQPSATTNIGAGLIDGFQQINQDFVGTRRVFLVSDGLNNVGMSNSDVLDLVSKRDQFGKNITVSTFGIGTDCDQELMADLAKQGTGNYYYIQDSSDMKETFARELGGALACEAQNIEIRIRPNNGNTVDKILNDFTVEDDNGTAVIKAEDLYIGETRHIVVQMGICQVDHPKPRPTSVAHVDINYYDVKKKTTVSLDSNVLVNFVKPDEADKEAKLKVREQVAILEIAEASIQAVKHANAGDFVRATAVYKEAAQSIHDCAAAGSVLCCSLQDDVNAHQNTWSSENYTESFGATRLSDSLGLRKMRGIVGMSVAAFTSKHTKKMISDFQQPDSKPSMQPAQSHLNASPVVDKEEEDTSDKKKGFTKHRSNRVH